MTSEMTFDLLLRGGQVADGTGAEPYTADVAVTRGRIEAIGDLGHVVAARVIDVSGRLVLPGLVDAHVHAETVLERADVQEAMLRQGVTTVILGQDGLSFAPGSAATVEYVARYFAAVAGRPPAAWRDGLDVDTLLRYFDRRTPLNVATLVPLANVRHDVLGPEEQPAGDRLPAMVGLVEAGLEQGAVGVSTGLEYVPGAFADLVELAALCEPAARIGAPYVSHLRSYADGVAPGMAEALELGRRTRVPLHISHYRGRAEPLLAHLEGADASFDSYPHLYGNTILAMRALPSHVQRGGVEATLERLRDPGVRAELAADWFPRLRDELAVTVLGHIGAPEFRWAQGLRVSEAAERAGLSPDDFVCELLVACDLVVNCVIPLVGGNSDDDIRALARDPRHMACSDGIYLGDHPHPRGWAAFARFLGRHTRDLGDWTWGQAARHLAGHAAERFSLAGRGIVSRGNVADLAIVDPGTVADRATYASPRDLATGVTHVVVGGEVVLDDGRLTGAAPGRGLRRGEMT